MNGIVYFILGLLPGAVMHTHYKPAHTDINALFSAHDFFPLKTFQKRDTEMEGEILGDPVSK